MSEPLASSPPPSETPSPSVEPELASRGERLLGAIIDGVISGVPAGAAAWALGLYDSALEGSPSFADGVAITVLGLVVFLAIHGTLIYGRAQTVGKWMLGMVVVGVEDDRPIDGNRYVLRRILPILAAGLVPVAGGFVTLANPLFIFGRERRCLHDYIAGTRVIKACGTARGPAPGP